MADEKEGESPDSKWLSPPLTPATPVESQACCQLPFFPAVVWFQSNQPSRDSPIGRNLQSNITLFLLFIYRTILEQHRLIRNDQSPSVFKLFPRLTAEFSNFEALRRYLYAFYIRQVHTRATTQICHFMLEMFTNNRSNIHLQKFSNFKYHNLSYIIHKIWNVIFHISHSLFTNILKYRR